MNWKYYPLNTKPTKDIYDLINVFKNNHHQISSYEYEYNSNTVLSILSNDFINLEYKVEIGKKKDEKIRVPVLYGINGKEDLAFEADAFSADKKIVIEVEAGRAVTNYQFLKDFFQACMMSDVEYLCIGIRNIYKNNKDFDKVCKFFDSLYSSQRLIIPLKGLLIIGY